MKFTPATILALAAGASAQISLPLPQDLQDYQSSLSANGNAQAASLVDGLFAYSDIQSVVAGAVAHSITGAQLPLAFASAANAWVAAQPASAQPLASSVLNDVSERALTDGLLNELATISVAPGAVPTGSLANATVTSGTLVVQTTGANATNATSGAVNLSTTVVPTVITSGSVVITTSVPKTVVGGVATTATSPAGAMALTGATGFGAALIAGAFAAVAAL